MREASRHGWSHGRGCNGSWHGVPFQGLEQVAEHVRVEALARHQLAQESNLTQAAVDALKAWRVSGEPKIIYSFIEEVS